MRRFMMRAVRLLTLPLFGLAIGGFFVWHTYNGPRGLDAREARMAEIVTARGWLADAQSEQEALERRVAGFRGNEIDADQLDERARTLLNYVRPDEIVVPLRPPGG